MLVGIADERLGAGQPRQPVGLVQAVVHCPAQQAGVGQKRGGDTTAANEPEIVPDRKCPKCDSNLVIKRGRYGKFIGCSNFPECRYTEPWLEKIGVTCPKDQGELVERKTRKGRTFFGCENYPNCDFTSWKRPIKPPCPNPPCEIENSSRLSFPGWYVAQPGKLNREEFSVIRSNASASLRDLGDGVLAIALHSKMNAIGGDTLQMLQTGVSHAASHGVVCGRRIWSHAASVRVTLRKRSRIGRRPNFSTRRRCPGSAET